MRKSMNMKKILALLLCMVLCLALLPAAAFAEEVNAAPEEVPEAVDETADEPDNEDAVVEEPAVPETEDALPEETEEIILEEETELPEEEEETERQSGAPDLPKLAAPSNPHWDEEYPGVIVYTLNQPHQNDFQYALYQVGRSEPVSETGYRFTLQNVSEGKYDGFTNDIL